MLQKAWKKKIYKGLKCHASNINEYICRCYNKPQCHIEYTHKRKQKRKVWNKFAREMNIWKIIESLYDTMPENVKSMRKEKYKIDDNSTK